MSSDAIVCPWGHRHLLPVLSSSCWADRLPKSTETRSVIVTLREYDVARELLKDGGSNRTIGQRLFLSEDTIKTHMKNVLRRTHCGSRSELLAAIFTGRVRLVPVPNTSAVAHRQVEPAASSVMLA